MRKMKIAAIILTMCMVISGFVACNGTEKKEDTVIKATVTVKDKNGNKLIDALQVSFTNETPTVLSAVTRACDAADISYTLDGTETGFDVLAGHISYSEDNYYWGYTLDGVQPTEGKAGTIEIKDGAVIIFSYMPAPQ